MALIHGETTEVLKSELELFSVHPTQTSVEETRFVQYFPQTTLDRGGPIVFHIPPLEKEYLDPSKTFLYLKTRILSESGGVLPKVKSAQDNAVPKQSYVFPINYFHATCFKTVDIYLNNKNISANDTLYPYRAYIETLLSNTKDSKLEQLKAALYYQDKTPMDEVSESLTKTGNAQTTNTGALLRFTKTKFSNPFETFGRIHSEIFCQDKLLTGDVDLSIKFHRADNAFCLMSQDDTARYTISIDKAVLYVCQKRISASIREAHQIALQTRNLKYPVKKCQMKFFTRGAHRSDISEPNLVNGVLPKRITFALVDSDAFSGSLSKNPFNFQHFNLSNITLRKNGENIPFQAIEMDYETKCVMQGYLALLEGSSNLFRERSLDIQPMSDFTNGGFSIYCFDISQGHDHSKSFDLVETGNISLELKLAKTSDTSITIVTHLEYDAIIEIDKDGGVTYD